MSRSVGHAAVKRRPTLPSRLALAAAASGARIGRGDIKPQHRSTRSSLRDLTLDLSCYQNLLIDIVNTLVWTRFARNILRLNVGSVGTLFFIATR